MNEDIKGLLKDIHAVLDDPAGLIGAAFGTLVALSIIQMAYPREVVMSSGVFAASLWILVGVLIFWGRRDDSKNPPSLHPESETGYLELDTGLWAVKSRRCPITGCGLTELFVKGESNSQVALMCHKGHGFGWEKKEERLIYVGKFSSEEVNEKDATE